MRLLRRLLRRGNRIVRPAAPEPAVQFPVERRSLCLADLDGDGVRALITELDERADRLGCVVLHDGRPFDHVVVIFAGNAERYFMLAAARHVRCPVLYLQEPKSYWYRGSDVLPDLTTLCRAFLVREVGTAHAILFGQSAGAYAALAASTFLPASTVVACAPQTFPDGAAKARVRFVGIRPQAAPDDLLDLRDLLAGAGDPNSCRAVVIAVSETDNPVWAHYWMDYLHALRLADLPNIALFVVNENSHVIVHSRVNAFARLLGNLCGAIHGPPPERERVIHDFLTETFDAPRP